MIYTNPQTETEAGALLEYLKNIHGGNLSPEECDTLRTVFAETVYPGLRDLIGKILVEAEDEELYPLLIQKLKENIHTDYIGHLSAVAFLMNVRRIFSYLLILLF